MKRKRNRALAAIAAVAIAVGAVVGHELVPRDHVTTTITKPACIETQGDCVLEPELTPRAEEELSPVQRLGAVTPASEASVASAPELQPQSALSLGAASLPSGSNGRLSAKQLSPITGGVSGFPGSGQLANAPAAAWNTMSVRIHKATGVWLSTNGPDSAYRSFPRQQYWKDHWCSLGACQNAATPGQSNHGWGWAVDNSRDRALIERYGGPFGWRYSCSDAPWEPWHIKWCGGWSGRDPGPYGKNLFQPIKRGSKGKRVGTLTSHLALLAAPGKRDHFMRWSNRGKVCGKPCVSGIRRFQRAEHLGVDGVVGPKTDARLDARWAFYKKHHHRRGH